MNSQEFRAQTSRALNARDYRKLVQLCQMQRKLLPSFADAWFLESIAAEAGRNLPAAIKLAEHALSLEPSNVEYLVQTARYLVSANQTLAALNTAQRAIEIGSEDPLQLDTLGVVLTRLGRYADAAKFLRLAVQFAPENPQFQFNLAAAEQFVGNANASKSHYKEVIRLQPRNARAYWALSEIDKTNVSSDLESSMKNLSNDPKLRSTDRLYLAHALSRIDEHRGDFPLAMERLSEAKLRRSKELNYKLNDDLELFHALRDCFKDQSDISPQFDLPTPTGPKPLFVMGMPRTGTTLFERILVSHSAIDSLGELQDLPLTLKRLSGDKDGKVLSAGVIHAASKNHLPLADAYQQSITPRATASQWQKEYLVDKTPLNALLIGFVLRDIPDAKIVLVRRNPIDAGLSSFRQLFSLDYSYYNYSYDLADTGSFVAEFDMLCNHWESLCRDRIKVVRYEELIESPEPVVRGLLEHLKLEWEQECMEFHATSAPVATPSAAQVRQPLYKDAIGRWRRYGELLNPMIKAYEARTQVKID